VIPCHRVHGISARYSSSTCKSNRTARRRSPELLRRHPVDRADGDALRRTGVLSVMPEASSSKRAAWRPGGTGSWELVSRKISMDRIRNAVSPTIDFNLRPPYFGAAIRPWVLYPLLHKLRNVGSFDCSSSSWPPSKINRPSRSTMKVVRMARPPRCEPARGALAVEL